MPYRWRHARRAHVTKQWRRIGVLAVLASIAAFALSWFATWDSGPQPFRAVSEPESEYRQSPIPKRERGGGDEHRTAYPSSSPEVDERLREQAQPADRRALQVREGDRPVGSRGSSADKEVGHRAAEARQVDVGNQGPTLDQQIADNASYLKAIGDRPHRHAPMPEFLSDVLDQISQLLPRGPEVRPLPRFEPPTEPRTTPQQAKEPHHAHRQFETDDNPVSGFPIAE